MMPCSRLRVQVAAFICLATPQTARSDPFVRGIALGQHTDISDADLTGKLNELRWLGASHVSLVVSWSTRDVHSAQIGPLAGSTTSDAVLERMVTRAHALGFKVLLFPILDVQRRRAQEWRGALVPSDWDVWWRSYHRFVLHYAALAMRARVEIFSIGSELVTTEKMRGRWVTLAREVRKIYPGKILYSANWDHYAPVAFWDAVDMVGLTAYYKLADRVLASEREMETAWREAQAHLVAWSRKTKRPFVFTEVGYPSITGGAITPWDYTRDGPPSPEEQRRAYKAFIRAWSGVPALAGVFFWDWYGNGGKEDRGYTPRGKPAEHLIRAWYLATDR
jgi:hypothetical protein